MALHPDSVITQKEQDKLWHLYEKTNEEAARYLEAKEAYDSSIAAQIDANGDIYDFFDDGKKKDCRAIKRPYGLRPPALSEAMKSKQGPMSDEGEEANPGLVASIRGKYETMRALFNIYQHSAIEFNQYLNSLLYKVPVKRYRLVDAFGDGRVKKYGLCYFPDGISEYKSKSGRRRQ